MRFDFSVLRDFRSLRRARFDWAPGLNLILGPNGSGNTNLRESLNVLSGWGTFGRTAGAVSWGCGGAALLGARVSGEEEHELQVRISTRMTPRVDEKRVTCTDLRLVAPSITFLPTDINLIDGSPSVRRLFVDRLCALCSPPYARRLSEFHQISRHRVALLKQGRDVLRTNLPFARLGGWIMEARRYFMAQLSTFPGGALPFPFSFSMTPELAPGEDSPGTKYLLRALEETAERERYAQRPLVGPGRDDLEIVSGEHPASESLSRGQKRRLVLSLILRAGRMIERLLRRKPILLFDDLAAELDTGGRQAAGAALLDTGWQVFITGTENPFTELPAAEHFLPV